MSLLLSGIARLQRQFARRGSAGRAKAELRILEVPYKIKPDGTVFVPGEINLLHRGLTKLPDLSAVEVGGSFYCGGNQLTSLEGAPAKVGRSFVCDSDTLASLKGAPREAGGFYCRGTRIETLEGAPEIVKGDFVCGGNQLRSLNGAPRRVPDGFDCSDNPLESLDGAPEEIGKVFRCKGNKLPDLKSAPRRFGSLVSDFGDFSSPQKLEKFLDRKPRGRAAKGSAYATKAPLTILRPIRLRLPGSVP